MERCLSHESISVEIATITQANLAYLFNLINSPASAIETAELVFESPLKNTPAILHLPFWFSDQVFPDPMMIPGRNITPLEASQVCYITASLMLDEVERVLPFIPVVQSWSDEQPHRYLVLASIFSKQRKSVLAKECLNKALDLTEEEGERKMIQTWLRLVED